MDAYTTASTAIRDIYAITKFVQLVIKEIQEHDKSVSDIQGELEHEFLFLEIFKTLFFDEGGNGNGNGNGKDNDRPGQWFKSLDKRFQQDVDNILRRLKRCLDAYDNVALKHGLDLSEAAALLPKRQDEQIEPRESPKEPPVQAPPVQAEDLKKGTFKTAILRFKAKRNKLEWALFEKKEVEKLVQQYQTWTEKLRQIMTLIILVTGRLGSHGRSHLEAKEASWIKALGVAGAVRRQIRGASEHPRDFDPVLKGSFAPTPLVDHKTVPSSYVPGKLDELYQKVEVIMERHDFAIYDDSKSEDQKKPMKLELVRRLAWLLHDPEGTSSAESAKPEDGTTPMSLLQCLGYYSLTGERRQDLCLVYKVPPHASAPTTLHEWISHGKRREELRILESEIELQRLEGKLQKRKDSVVDGKTRITRERYDQMRAKVKVLESKAKLEDERDKSKPNLSTRFFLAWTLASTLYNIHASGWVHKNIWSHAILIFRPLDGASPGRSSNHPVPYLLGWSVSRPQTEEFRLMSKAQQTRHSNLCGDDWKSDSDVGDDSIEPGDIDLVEELENAALPPDDDDAKTTEDPPAEGGATDTAPPNLHGGSKEDKQPEKPYNLEQDLCRHRERWKIHKSTFENKHDIYSLGIVLLEIGLWSTVSMEMSKAISGVKREGRTKPLQQDAMQRLANDLVEKSRGRRLAQQMGTGYAEIVERCLTGKFESLKGEEAIGRRNAELAREFHESVVESLRLSASVGVRSNRAV